MSDHLVRYFEAERAKASRRKCFISYYAGDTAEVDRFLADFQDAFIPKVIGVTDQDDFIDSTDSDYVMSKIREKYLGDSTVTICLIGSCTHSRRYIDWELKATLRQGSYTPNGLLGVMLPSRGKYAHLPPRFSDNLSAGDQSRGYGRYKVYPDSVATLKGWIEDCYARRTSHALYISNSQSMFVNNRKCLVRSEWH
jgi:hypothetical protein